MSAVLTKSTRNQILILYKHWWEAEQLGYAINQYALTGPVIASGRMMLTSFINYMTKEKKRKKQAFF